MAEIVIRVCFFSLVNANSKQNGKSNNFNSYLSKSEKASNEKNNSSNELLVTLDHISYNNKIDYI